MGRLRRKQRITMLIFGGVALAMSTTLVAVTMGESFAFFYGPSELLAKAEEGAVPADRRTRLGGMVVVGSRAQEGETVRFRVTDTVRELPVVYRGILPDLFAEGQGVVAEGYFEAGVFRAEDVLAKHDEKYMPREVQDALEEAGRWQTDGDYSDGDYR